MPESPSLQANLAHPPLKQMSLQTLHLHPTISSASLRHIRNGREVPSGSLAMVGYMMGCYEKDDKLVATPNLS